MDNIQIILTGIAGGLLVWLWAFLIIYYRSNKVKKPKDKKNGKISKTRKLTYIVVFLWIVYGILAIWQNMSLEQLAGYYASLTLFVSTYLWGEFRRSSVSTDVFSSGKNSSREVMIYIVLLLWATLGAFGIFILEELNSLTVYFGSLSPFVMSYIIYKTTKGYEHIPEFDEVEVGNINTNNQRKKPTNKYEDEPGYWDDVEV